MLRYKILLFLTFITSITFGQNDSRDLFVSQLFQAKGYTNLKVSSNIPSRMVSRVIRVLENEEIIPFQVKSVEKCLLTGEEKKYLLDLLKREAILPITFFEDKLEIASEEYKDKIVSLGEGKIHTFSEPVFLRDNTLAFSINLLIVVQNALMEGGHYIS
ncbi:hypothetical protein [Belliella pelovolcani]|uniref:Uncharacterized protein n=1 Tax=Belliella pelovolcani TaxID=529505 RepID=A0A1N7PDQ6_9BACT|nr:hypothetical protein [Belliella pelovolcani]SIT08519.1 hypothetical protein SAMN05421761_11576 [Belliella pelovolcani]